MRPEKFFAHGSLIAPQLPNSSQPLEKSESPEQSRVHEIVGVSGRAMKIHANARLESGQNSVERKDISKVILGLRQSFANGKPRQFHSVMNSQLVHNSVLVAIHRLL